VAVKLTGVLAWYWTGKTGVRSNPVAQLSMTTVIRMISRISGPTIHDHCALEWPNYPWPLNNNHCVQLRQIVVQLSMTTWRQSALCNIVAQLSMTTSQTGCSWVAQLSMTTQHLRLTQWPNYEMITCATGCSRLTKWPNYEMITLRWWRPYNLVQT